MQSTQLQASYDLGRQRDTSDGQAGYHEGEKSMAWWIYLDGLMSFGELFFLVPQAPCSPNQTNEARPPTNLLPMHTLPQSFVSTRVASIEQHKTQCTSIVHEKEDLSEV